MAEDAYSWGFRLAKALQNDLEERINRTLRELGDPYLVRARRVSSRIKSRSSLERKAKGRGWTLDEAVGRAEDFLGFRVVCSNLQDVQRAAQLFTEAIEAGSVTVKRRDYIESPKSSGYRAIHLLFRSEVKIGAEALSIGCEIQIRTLVQDAWGHLSHEDIYKGSPSRRLLAKTRRLSEVLARADRIAEGIRSEVVTPKKGRKPEAGAPLTRSSIAFVYHRAFGERPPNYLVEWILREHGGATLRADGLDQVLQDKQLLSRLEGAYSDETRWGPGPEQLFRWAVVASMNGMSAAVKAASQDGRNDWRDVDRQFKSELSSSVPENVDDLRGMLVNSEHDGDSESVVVLWAEYFDAADTCDTCGTSMVDVYALAQRLVKHFKLRGQSAQQANEKILQMLTRVGVESLDGALCSACRYMMNRDD